MSTNVVHVTCPSGCANASAGQAGDQNIVYLTLPNDRKGKITFLDNGIFRYQVVRSESFEAYAAPRDPAHKARIPQYPDTAEQYAKPHPQIAEETDHLALRVGEMELRFAKESGVLQILQGGRVVLEEERAMEITDEQTTMYLRKQNQEAFFGGGTQNGRFVHTGKQISIVNESAWMDGGVASPNPFYYTTAGYGILRNTFSDGFYDFGCTEESLVQASHKESHFDAYFFITSCEDGRLVVQDLLRKYYQVTGNPLLLPEYGFYEGHLNCYNRDSWSEESGAKEWNVKGTAKASDPGVSNYESGMATGYRLEEGQHAESLNGEMPVVATEHFPANVDTPYQFSARAVLDQYIRYDMPLGYFLPNDGYGGGYGQNGYYQQGGVNEDGSSTPERLAAVSANVENLTHFTKYANERGVASGLWTECNLSPDSDPNTYWHLLRDFQKEVSQGGATTLKTDVAWVGPGYSFQLDGVKTAYDIVTGSRQFRPNIISLDGWAGSQRFNSVWTGDQTGGNWEYIRFHIPTYIGSSLSGNPNIGSDMDGIFGGKPLIAARDFQWKSFTPQMLNMDGWGSYMKAPFTFGDPYTGINRMYMKMKAKLMPYIYTTAVAASNIDTGNQDTGLPMVRAMFLEFPKDAYAYSRNMKYQYLFGASILVAPVYQNTAGDEQGNDVRNGIYLPDENAVWIDYLTGEKYQGGQVLDNFDAPLWKLPVFVKNGSILPMYAENNTPSEIDRTKRIVELWPDGESRYTVYEDNGTYIKNDAEHDEEYGLIDHISYGDHVSTTYASSTADGVAVFRAEASTGSYPGYESVRQTDLIVHLTQKPEWIKAQNGETELTVREVTDKAAFDSAVPAAQEAIFFYEESPALQTYASAEETELHAMTDSVRTSPKLYIRLAPVDTAAQAQTVTVGGFVNAFCPMADVRNANLTAPVLTENTEAKTPTSILLTWNEVEGAQQYEMLVDGRFHSMSSGLSYLHDELEYESEHRYQIRSRNQEGYSDWSDEYCTATLIDPWRNEVGAHGTITFEGDDEAGALKYATDHSTKGLFFAADDIVGKKIPFVYDFKSVYDLDKFEYYPRDSYGSGCVQQMNISSSLDGKHWNLVWDGTAHEDWTYNKDLDVEENVKTVSLAGVSARFLKLEIQKSTRNYFAAHELPVYKKDGSAGYAVGSTNKNETVSAGDYTNMKNYLGTCWKDGANFVDQIQKRSGDINMNGIYDVYDYAYTMFQLDGGTKQSGEVSGVLHLTADQEQLHAGDVLTLTVHAEDVQNMNAFGKVLHYDPELLEFVSVSQAECIRQMENLTVNKVYADGTAYVNLAFANRGDQALYSGSDSLVTITMKARKDLCPKEVLELERMTLIGPGYDTVEA